MSLWNKDVMYIIPTFDYYCYFIFDFLEIDFTI